MLAVLADHFKLFLILIMLSIQIMYPLIVIPIVSPKRKAKIAFIGIYRVLGLVFPLVGLVC